MKVSPIGSNMTEITLSNGTRILYSYETPVAARLVDGSSVRTNTFYSNTTSKHINKYLGKGIGESVDQSFLEQLA